MWLIESQARQALENAYMAGNTPTVAQRLEFDASRMSGVGASSRLLTVAGETAEIAVHGVLTKSPDLMSMIFGGGNTTYPEIVEALAVAETNPAIKDIVLNVDTPGGQFSGLFDVIAAIRASSKPITALVTGQASSAGYAIVSQADKIIAKDVSVFVGSIGTAVSLRVDDNTVDLASTDAPNKRPDVRTEEGKAVVREELDAAHNIFVEAISEGRGITSDKINADFGQGSVLFAEEALKRGMIDSIAAPRLKVGGINSKQEIVSMDITKLQAEHPSVYAEAVQVGVTQERDRVSAHLTMGEASGDTKTAFKAIEEGAEMTALLTAKYQAAAMNRDAISARDGDDASAADGAEASAAAAEEGSEVADLVLAKLGTEV